MPLGVLADRSNTVAHTSLIVATRPPEKWNVSGIAGDIHNDTRPVDGGTTSQLNRND